MDTVELSKELRQVAEVVASVAEGCAVAPTKLVLDGIDTAIDRLIALRQLWSPDKKLKDADDHLLRPIFGDSL